MDQVATKSLTSMNHPTAEKYAVGKEIAVGAHKVQIMSYLAEGGFAQIYVVKFMELLNEFESLGTGSCLKVGDVACLKRVTVNDEDGLNEMRNEVEVMKKLKGAHNVVEYYDSNASRRHDGTNGFEVLLLMELCPNKSLLDYMNQRLKTKLNEGEILKIMYDISWALSHMHYLQEPLIHRDVKIENVLVDAHNNFKLCDFGSTSQCSPVMVSHQDIAMLTQNIYVHTTPQYRAPEMIDLYRYIPINEKSDIWALGIFLYKLLFYRTPFETTGQFAILHSKYEFPPNNYSSKLINLIIIMLSENPNLRPNIYQVLSHICSIMNIPVPIDDIYGLGPYNFELYTDFQGKVQKMQNQINSLQQRTVKRQTPCTQDENMQINDLFVSAFEMIPKIPIPNLAPRSQTQSRLHLSTQTSNDDNTEKRKSIQEDRISRQTSNTISHKSIPTSGNVIERTISDHSKNETRHTSNDVGGQSGESYFPSVTELNTLLDNEYQTQKMVGQSTQQQIHSNMADGHLNIKSNPQRQKSITSFSTGGKSVRSSSHGAQPENVVHEEGQQEKSNMQNYMKSANHKSNNPFPMMKPDHLKSNDSLRNNPYYNEIGSNNNLVNNTNVFDTKNGVEDKIYPNNIHQNPQNIPQTTNPPIMNFVPGTSMNINYDTHQQINYNAQPNMNLNKQMTQPKALQSQQTQPHSHQAQHKPQSQTQPQQRPFDTPDRLSQNFIPFPPRPQVSQQQIPQLGQNMGYGPIGQPEAKQSNQSRPIAGWNYNENTEPHAHNPTQEKSLIDLTPEKKNTSPFKNEYIKKDINGKYIQQRFDLGMKEVNMSDTSLNSASVTGEMDNSLLSSESIDIDMSKNKTRHYPGVQENKTDKERAEAFIRKHSQNRNDATKARKSLDLKLQEVHFASPEPSTTRRESRNNDDRHAYLQGIQSHDSLDDTLSSLPKKKPMPRSQSSKVISDSIDRRASLEAHSKHHSDSKDNRARHELKHYASSNGSNSSINISTTNKTEMRKSFAKARQSLDLERARRDALLRSNSNSHGEGKRRSLFSMFK
ncbi:Serine/threonine-protein kinase AKL1 [Nakaseomyces bracarensis]|uniref:Serine/threonine-protein kinase AKL1 n=1 Tax=Nakaseomyces bracarensis TaxID=273131 RepID=A0ABR4NMB8_9SACH